MKITAIETSFTAVDNRNWLFVKVLTDEGIHGWGEAGVEGKELTVAQAIHELERYLVGKDPFRIEDHWSQMYRGGYWVGGPILNSALSGIELALFDIKGKALGVPVYELLGGKVNDRVRAYANGWFRGAKTPSNYARLAVETVEKGYTALKWDPFGGSGLFIDQEQSDLAVACVKAVREAVGPKIDLLIEVHGRLSPANAIRMAYRLEEFNPFFYEEPVPPENADAMALVARSIRIPVATGERLFTRWDFKDVIEKQAAAVLQPDICHVGGIWELRKIAAMAEVYYMGIAPHNPNGPICTAASVHLDACIPNFLIQESLLSDQPLRNDIQSEPYRVVNGYFEVPDRPGWGIELDEALIAQHGYQPRDMYRMIGPQSNMRWD